MSEQIRGQISAFTDDELSAEECAFLVRRLGSDPASRDKALRYSIIGAALRGELPNPDPTVLCRRIRAELDGIGRVESSRRAAPARRRMLRHATGFGIAAGVAVAALALLNTMNRPLDATAPAAGIAETLADIGFEAQPSYTVPQPTADRLAVGDALAPHPIRLTNYLITHGQYASGIRRTSIHTNVISDERTAVPVTAMPVSERTAMPASER